MKNQTPEYEAVLSALNNLPLEQILIGQCASLCSCFISGAYISATSTELLNELVRRHKGNLDKQSVENIIKQVLAFGVDSGALTIDENQKYSPTEMGWFIGKDWEMKVRLNDFSIGV
jgi:hypothetical protein